MYYPVFTYEPYVFVTILFFIFFLNRRDPHLAVLPAGPVLTILTPLPAEHREITLIELQSLVVFGCTALLFMVGATASTHDREEGWYNFLFVYTE